MKQKRAFVDESIIYIAGIVILFLFFAGLIFSVLFLSASNSKQNYDSAKTASLKTLTNSTFAITLIIIFIVLMLILISHIFKAKVKRVKKKIK